MRTPKASRKSKEAFGRFRTKCFGVRCVFASLSLSRWRCIVRLSIDFSKFRHQSDAKNSSDGLCRQPTADVPAYRPTLASMAIPVTTATFQCPAPTRTEFCALDSRFRDRSSRDVAHSDRDCDLDATATFRVIELVSPANLGCRDRDVSFDGLRLLVVALGHAHGAVFLAIP